MSTCDLGPIIRYHIVALMQLLTNEVKSYNMRLLTTKCLNTAVMVWYLFLGEQQALPFPAGPGGGEAGKCDIGVCDSSEVQTRGRLTRATAASREAYLADPQHPLNVTAAFGRDLLAADPPAGEGGERARRKLYYVLLSDTELPRVMDRPDAAQPQTQTQPQGKKAAASPRVQGGGDEYFPGHVFVIEKVVLECGRLRFHTYQSYINHYDLSGHYEFSKSGSMSEAGARRLVDGLTQLYGKRVWDPQCTRFWKWFTHVDCSSYEGCQFSEQSWPCFTTCSTDNCTSRLQRLVQARLDDLRGALRTGELKPDAVYGDAKRYDRARANTKELVRYTDEIPKPLTNQQMLEEMEELIGKL